MAKSRFIVLGTGLGPHRPGRLGSCEMADCQADVAAVKAR